MFTSLHLLSINGNVCGACQPENGVYAWMPEELWKSDRGADRGFRGDGHSQSFPKNLKFTFDIEGIVNCVMSMWDV